MALDLISCMKSFVAVADQGSFALAARNAWISKAVVTKQIQRLEDLLGKRLFERTTRRLHLTEAGTLYLCHVKKILGQIASANDAILNLEPEPHGVITIGLPAGFNSMFFSKQFQEFLEKYPKVALHITNENFPNVIVDGYADIVISSILVDDQQLIKEKLMRVSRSIFAAPYYLEKYGTPKTIDDLKHHNCIINTRISPDFQWEFAQGKKVQVKGNYVSAGGLDVLHAAVNGIGLVWAPDFLVKTELESGQLVPVDIGAGPACIGLYLYYLPVGGDSPIKLMADFLVSRAQVAFVELSCQI